MSHYSIIHDVTLELRRQIFAGLQATPDVDFQINNMNQDIVLDPPPDAATGSPMLSIFLYHIEPDQHLRNQPYLTPSPESLRYPPFPLQLHYLITPLDSEQEQNQLLLGRIIQLFHDNPLLTSINGVPLDNSFGGSSAEIRIMMETLSLEELSRIWYALNSVYQLSITYIVRVVTIDSLRPESAAHRITELQAVVGSKGKTG
ncbi:MAG: DUF4255 domain-containing protein [Chloroflexi bacterium]|nr:DUF4255 domain-containing protein [Chloroflexota bacterium]